MLKLINLYIIDCILNQTDYKISQRAKILYINCLIYHFKNKSASVSNAVAFDLTDEDLCGLKNYEKLFKELEKAELIQLGVDKVAFHNVWGKYINSDDLKKVPAENYVAELNLRDIQYFKDDLKSNESIIELSIMKYKISKDDIVKLMDIFIQEQITFQKKYYSYSDCIKHFTFWLPTNFKNIPQIQDKTVKSKGKILGYE